MRCLLFTKNNAKRIKERESVCVSAGMQETEGVSVCENERDKLVGKIERERDSWWERERERKMREREREGERERESV